MIKGLNIYRFGDDARAQLVFSLGAYSRQTTEVLRIHPLNKINKRKKRESIEDYSGAIRPQANSSPLLMGLWTLP